MSGVFPNHVDDLVGQRADLAAYLDRRAAMRAALDTLLDGVDSVGWVADVGADSVLRLDAIGGDRSGTLGGLVVPEGLGLTGKVLGAAQIDWVDDYTGSDSITHTYDAHIEQEGIRDAKPRNPLQVHHVGDGTLTSIFDWRQRSPVSPTMRNANSP